MTVLDQILSLLDERGVSYRHLHHVPTRTSEDSARERGEPLAIGAKAIVMKLDDRFVLLVMSAERRIDSAALRSRFNAGRSRFATPDELLRMTGLVPGSVPPFGPPILDLPLYVDPSVFENDRVAFNAGSLTDSVILGTDDYRTVADPTVASFTQPPNTTSA